MLVCASFFSPSTRLTNVKAHCHCRAVRSASYCSFRAQDGCWLLTFPLHCGSGVRLPNASLRWCRILLRCPNHRQKLVLRQHCSWTVCTMPFYPTNGSQLSVIIFFIATVQMFYYVGLFVLCRSRSMLRCAEARGNAMDHQRIVSTIFYVTRTSHLVEQARGSSSN